MAKKNVFIIDDDPEFRFITARILDNIGLEVIESENLAEAYDKIDRILPNLIILDLNLADESGFSFIEFSNKDKRLRSVPIIVCSQQILKKVIYKVYSMGVTEFITKPIKSSLLVQKVKKLLRDADPLVYEFPEGEYPTVKAQIDADLIRLSDLNCTVSSSCKFSKGTLVEIKSKLFNKLGVKCKKMEATDMGFSRESGTYDTPFTLIGLTENCASKIRGAKNQWKLHG